MENVKQLFSYEEMTKRNFGFVNQKEQDLIRQTSVFICGVGGMGGACLLSLVRAGLEHVSIADMDVFEVSNLNRQVFANLNTVNKDKAESTMIQLKDINPNVKVTNYGANWLDKIDEIMKTHKIIVNGCDDILATIKIYRKAREYGATVIDAYTSPLPSVYVTRPEAPPPEIRLNFPSRHIKYDDLDKSFTKDIENECKFQEIVHVLVNSSSISHIYLDAAVEMVAGKRSRMSLSTMVITTGNLMAYQVLGLILGKKKLADENGFFLDALSGKIEKPLMFPFSVIKKMLVVSYLRRLLK